MAFINIKSCQSLKCPQIGRSYTLGRGIDRPFRSWLPKRHPLANKYVGKTKDIGFVKVKQRTDPNYLLTIIFCDFVNSSGKQSDDDNSDDNEND